MELIHLFIDGRNVKRNLEGQRGYDVVYAALNDIPDMLVMKKMADKPIIWAVNKGEGKDGFSGIMPIEESHISLHTFFDTHQYFADIFSCKEFNVGLIVGYFKLIYGGDARHSVHLRGVNDKV